MRIPAGHAVAVDAVDLGTRNGGHADRLRRLRPQGVGDGQQSRGKGEIQGSRSSARVHGQGEGGGLAAGIIGGQGKDEGLRLLPPVAPTVMSA